MGEEKIKIQFCMRDNVFYIDVPSILNIIENHPDVDLAALLKITMHNIQNEMEGLPHDYIIKMGVD